jgi:hypothetical protein
VSTTGARIVRLALAARTPAEAEEVQRHIEAAVGARHERPVGDRWNNQGLITQSGTTFDHKILELVTNMQDAVLEREALKAWPNPRRITYTSPREAEHALLGRIGIRELASQMLVTIGPSGPPNNKKRMSIVFRDKGCGMTPEAVPRTIFQIGASHKDGVDWLQGTFGLGGATTYRNAEAVVLATRRDPQLLGRGEEDRITVAVIQWSRHRTTVNAYYLATQPWDTAGDDAPPFSVSAAEVAGFSPGTHLALINFGSDTLARKSGDEKSFQAVFDTRLFEPVMPITYQNTFVRDRVETLYGLGQRLDNNPAEPGFSGRQSMPFNVDGTTYQLPVRFRLFAKPGAQGERRSFVANGHAVLLTSNGQVHAHWSGQEFKSRTTLRKLSDRILVVVETDALPIELRTALFTADRSQLVRTSEAVRLEEEVSTFIDDWPALRDANDALIREEISRHAAGRPTLEVAQKIARAFKARGFAAAGGTNGKIGGRTKIPPALREIDLLADPTRFDGPHQVEAAIGRTKSVFYELNTTDDFLRPGGRGTLHVSCDHPGIGVDEITVGQLRSGRVRVTVAVPDTDDLGIYELQATIPPWTRASGGLGPEFTCTTKIDVVDEIRLRPGGRPGDRSGRRGPSSGDLVALIWQTDAEVESWTPNTVGVLEEIPAATLAETTEEYRELIGLDGEIPTIRLNTTYTHLKSYIQARTADLSAQGVEQCRERYAVGVGVALLCLSASHTGRRASSEQEEESIAAAARAAARGVLSVLPDYDRLAKEISDGT